MDTCNSEIMRDKINILLSHNLILFLGKKKPIDFGRLNKKSF